MMKQCFWAIATIVMMSNANFAFGETRRLTLKECIEESENHNLSIKAAKLSAEKAELMRGTVLDLPRTGVALTQESTSGGSPDNGITVSQEFDFPTLYVARHKSLKAESAFERSNYNVARAEVVKEISDCYYQLLHAQAVVAVREKQDSVLADYKKVMDEKYRQGETSRLNQIQASKIYEENRMELRAARDARDVFALDMQRLLNTEDEVVPSEPATSVIEFANPESELYFASTPQGESATARVALGEKNLSVAKQNFLPGFSVAATNKLLIKGFNPYDVEREPFKGNFVKFEVGVTLPIFFGAERARLRSARKDVEMARVMRVEAEQTATKEYRAALSAYNTAYRNLNYYRNEAIGQADEIERLAKVSYELGEIEYVEMIENVQSAIDIRLRYADAVKEYNLSVIKLNYLQGKL